MILHRESPEARFAHAMDNFQPLLLNHSNGGADWKAHEVSRSKVEKRHSNTKDGSTFIGEYSMSLIEENVKKGSIRDE